MKTLGIVASDHPKETVVFFDDFLGSSVDTTKWAVYDRISDQSNGEVNCVSPANVVVSGSTLQITAKAESHVCGDTTTGAPNPRTMSYTSGQVAHKTFNFLYGTVDVRAKAPGGIGLWPCIWLLGFEWQASQPVTANTPEHQWPQNGWCETDISEWWQNGRTTTNCTLHYQSAGGLHICDLPFDATTRFMVYRLVWRPGEMIWYCDGEDGAGFRELFRITGSVPNVAQYLILHIAIGGTGGGTPNPATFPQTMEIDWAKVTQ